MMLFKMTLHRCHRISEHPERYKCVFRALVFREAINIPLLTADGLHAEQRITRILFQILIHKGTGLQPQRRQIT